MIDWLDELDMAEQMASRDRTADENYLDTLLGNHARELIDAAKKVDRLISRGIEDMHNEIDNLKALLRRIEWHGECHPDHQCFPACPECSGSYNEGRKDHAPDCELVVALGNK